MSKLYLFNYNNYFNRIFKKESSLADYGTPIYSLTANFNYNDGVDTYHDINYNGQDGDYFIVCDDEDTIVSRWFVLENKRNRGGQHRLTLKRDLKVDMYDLYKDSPMIIHRGWLPSTSSLLFNTENFSLNQIKKEEILLEDPSTIPWYVVYFAKNASSKNGSIGFGGSRYISDTVNTPIAESIYANGSTDYFGNITYLINAQQKQFSGYFPTIREKITSSGARSTYSEERADYGYVWFEDAGSDIQIELDNEFDNKYNAIHTLDTEHTNPNGTDAKIAKLLEMNGKYVKDSLNKVYYISVSSTSENKEEYTLNSNVTDYIKGRINTLSLTRTGDWGDEAFGISYTKERYVVTATLDTANTVSWSIDFSNKQKSNDSTFNVIAFPAKTACVTTSVGDYFMTEDISKLFIASLIDQYGTDFIYDVQLLPYNPLGRAFDVYDDDYNAPVIFGDDHTGRVLSSEVYFDRPQGSSSGDGCLCFYYIKDTTFTLDISKNLSLDNYNNDTSVNIKLNNECNLYRLVSPNYNGQFEFSVAKNNGVSLFNVDITLRPYNPYIHINPNFKNIYGRDFNDSRGLICQGDFSVPLIKDAWTTYELQNKNYQNIFNRQIENMDFTQRQERIQAMVGLAVGGAQGATTGAAMGGMVGGLPGAIAGGLAGGVSSLATGIADWAMLGERQAEQKDYVIDNFNYQLGNIKALPYSITKVTPFTANNKIFPFVEKYTATDEEINILSNRLEYSSFTVETIGTINNHISNRPNGTKKFVSGTLIRLESADMATHELQELASELEKGVYI